MSARGLDAPKRATLGLANRFCSSEAAQRCIAVMQAVPAAKVVAGRVYSRGGADLASSAQVSFAVLWRRGVRGVSFNRCHQADGRHGSPVSFRSRCLTQRCFVPRRLNSHTLVDERDRNSMLRGRYRMPHRAAS